MIYNEVSIKWFKHDTDGNRSEAISKIKAEFGLEGVARWYFLLEAVAEKMDETDRCFLELSIQDFMAILDIKREKLFRKFAQFLENFGGNSVEFRENFCRISIPNLLKKRDNHTKNLQATYKQEQDTEQRVKSKEQSYPPNPPKGEECVLSESETDVLFKWNQLAEQFPKIPKVLKLSEIRKGHVKQRLAESEFEFDKILSGIRGSPFLTGQTNGFKVTFDWVFSSKNNYLKVLEGNYGNATNGNGHKSPIVAKLEERSRAKL